jgi:hypothetical protein
MSQRWRALQRVMLSPGKIGDITKAVLVLVQFEHKMISGTPPGAASDCTFAARAHAPCRSTRIDRSPA